MKRIIYVILFFVISEASIAQDTIFIKSYGNIGYNYGEKVIQTSDTGYILLVGSIDDNFRFWIEFFTVKFRRRRKTFSCRNQNEQSNQNSNTH